MRQLLITKPILQLNVRRATPTHKRMRDAVTVAMPGALDKAQVAKVGAELALMGLFKGLRLPLHVMGHLVGAAFQLTLLLF